MDILDIRGAAGRINTRSNPVQKRNLTFRIINVEKFCDNCAQWKKF